MPTFVARASALGLMVAGLAGCSGSPQPAAPRTLTLADSGSTVQLRAGERIVARLESNRTTGYGWTWIDSPAVPLVLESGPNYEAPASNAVGAGGYETFTFRAASTGEGTLSMTYRRPWEPEAPPGRRYSVRVLVK